jgi:hypothetical protein
MRMPAVAKLPVNAPTLRNRTTYAKSATSRPRTSSTSANALSPRAPTSRTNVDTKPRLKVAGPRNSRD